MAKPKRTLVLGTGNAKKRAELVQLLDLPGLDLVTLADFPSAPTIVEDGDTFLANATKKASTLAHSLGHWVLGEDSGLVVDALGGAPGIYSARWAGEPCDDECNNDRLLAELGDLPHERRTAHYVCVAVIADSTGATRAWAEGRRDGHITTERRGTGGFGYDPLFWIEEARRTYGELPTEVKHATSHRAAAIRQLRPRIIELIESGVWPPSPA